MVDGKDFLCVAEGVGNMFYLVWDLFIWLVWTRDETHHGLFQKDVQCFGVEIIVINVYYSVLLT